MRFYHYILLFLLISIILRVYYIYYKLKQQLKDKGIINNKKIKEGFESLESCLWQGYPTQFCKRAPLQACVTNCGENYQ